MKESDYLRLVGEAYHETIFMAGSKIEPRKEIRKNLFRHILIRNQKVAQEKQYVTKEEFIIQCNKAFEKLRIYCEKRTRMIRNQSPTQEEIDDIDSGCYYINMSSLIPETVTKTSVTRMLLCNRDFNCMQEWLENFSFDNQDQNDLELIKASDSSLGSDEILSISKEMHGEMFANGGFKLFEHILNEYVKPKNLAGRYEDLSYYYRCLFEDGYIHQRPEAFRNWFNTKYSEDFIKIKTKIISTNPQRKKNYSEALNWFKLQRTIDVP